MVMLLEDTLTLTSLWAMFNTRGLYILGYSWLCGMSVWVAALEGLIAKSILPRRQFGAFQRRTFAVYFMISICLASALLLLWVLHHPNVLTRLNTPLNAEVAQAYALASIILLQGVNHFVVGPEITKTMTERQKLVKAELSGEYNHMMVLEGRKALNLRFQIYHGVGALANLVTLLALIFHGLCLAASVLPQ